MVFFLSLLFRNFDDRLSSNFHRSVILCICWDIASEKTGLLTITNSVQCVKHKTQIGVRYGAYKCFYNVMTLNLWGNAWQQTALDTVRWRVGEEAFLLQWSEIA